MPDLATKVRQSLRHGSRALVTRVVGSGNGEWIRSLWSVVVSLATSFIDRCLSDIEGLLSSVIDHSASAFRFDRRSRWRSNPG